MREHQPRPPFCPLHSASPGGLATCGGRGGRPRDACPFGGSACPYVWKQGSQGLSPHSSLEHPGHRWYETGWGKPAPSLSWTGQPAHARAERHRSLVSKRKASVLQQRRGRAKPGALQPARPGSHLPTETHPLPHGLFSVVLKLGLSEA